MTSRDASPETAEGRARDRLNRETPDVTSCAWPGCRKSMWMPLPGGGRSASRFGVLCRDHAVDVAVAVIEDQKSLNRFRQVIAQQDSARIARGVQAQQFEREYEAELAARRQGREGFVYYIQIGDRLKIGFSTDVRKRMRAYPPESKLLAVEPGDRTLERDRHRQFNGSLSHGREWFAMTGDLLEHIDVLLAEHGEPPRRMSHHYGTKRQPMRLSRKP